jgi:hypothetical protein
MRVNQSNFFLETDNKPRPLITSDDILNDYLCSYKVTRSKRLMKLNVFYFTTTFPIIVGCISQKYGKTPGLKNM